MESMEECKAYYKEHGSLIVEKGRTLTTVTAREILEAIKDELSSGDLAIVKEAMLSLSKNGVDWRSRGEFVGEIKWYLTQMRDKKEFAKRLVERSMDHIQTTDDLMQQGRKLYMDQPLNYARYLSEGRLFFLERPWNNKIPVLKDGTPLEEFFLSDMRDYPEIGKNTISYYNYEKEVLAQVAREVPVLPIFLHYICPSSLSIEEENGMIHYGGYFNQDKEKRSVFISPFRKLVAVEDEKTIENVNILLFLMAQEEKGLYEVVDNLIQAFALEIPLRSNHVESDAFVEGLKRSMGKEGSGKTYQLQYSTVKRR